MALHKIADGLRRRPERYQLLLQAFFLVLSVAMFCVVLKLNKGFYSIDNLFHVERFKDLSYDSGHGIFPQFYRYAGVSGDAVATFYPWMSWIPFAIFDMMRIPTVLSLDLYPVIVTYLGLNVAYFAYLSYKRSRFQAWAFATLYCGSYVMMALMFMRSEYAEALSSMFAPLVLFGWLNIMKDGRHKWMMVTGLILMTFTHLTSPLLMIMALGFLTAVSFRKLDTERIKTFAESALIFASATCIVWLPIIVLMKTNGIEKPNIGQPIWDFEYAVPLSLTDFFKGFNSLWSLPDMVAFVLGVCRFRKLSYYGKRLFVLAGMLLFFNTPFLPWHWIAHTFLDSLQFPIRFSFIIRMCLTYVLAEIVVMNYKHARRTWRFVGVVSLMAFSLLLSVGVQKSEVHVLPYRMSEAQMDSRATLDKAYHSDYANRAFIERHRGMQGVSHVERHGGATDFTAKKPIKELDLPVMLYHAQRYRVYLDGHPVKFRWTRANQPQIQDVPQGRHRMTYRAPVMWYRYLAVLTTFVGLGWLLKNAQRTMKRRKH